MLQTGFNQLPLKNCSYSKCCLLIIFSLLLWLPSLLLGSNEMDSLKQRLQQIPEGEEKVKILNELGYLNHKIDVKETVSFAQQALELSKKIDYTRGKAHAYNILSIGTRMGGDKYLALEQLEKAIQLAESIGADDLLIKAYNTKSNALKTEGRLNTALVFLQKALDLANETKDDWGIAVIPVNIGSIHHNNGNYSLARTYFKQSIKEAQHQKKFDLMSWGLRMVADTYVKENNLTQAVLYLDKALSIAKKADKDRSIAYCQFSLARLYLRINKYKLAEQSALESFDLFRTIGDKEGVADVTKVLLRIYLDTKRPTKVINFMATHPDINRQFANIQSNLEILELIIAAHVDQADYKQAYEAGLELKAIQDSFNLDKKMNLVAELEEKYQLKKKETENTILRMEQQKQATIIEQQQRFNYYLLVVAALLTLLAFTTYNAYSNKRKNNLLLEEKVTERTQALKKANLQLMQSNKELERFAFVASHDLREPLMNIISFTKLLQKKFANTNDTSTKQFMKFIHENTLRMNSLILDTLEFTGLSSEEIQLEVVDLNTVLSDIQAAIASTLEQNNALIQIVQGLPSIHSNKAMMFSLFKNLIENGIKYNEATQPTILINYETDKQFYIFSISDNGIGIPTEFQDVIFEMFKRLQTRDKYKGTGLGLANCKKIVTKLGGDLWVESVEDVGSTFYFTMKKELDTSEPHSIKKVPELMRV